MENTSLGFFYQCYNNPKVVERVLSSVRKFYFNAPIWVWRDGSETNFDYLIEKYNINYVSSNYHTSGGNGLYFPSYKNARIFIDRIKETICNSLVDKILLLEDDVLIQKQLNMQINENSYGVVCYEEGFDSIHLFLEKIYPPLFSGGCILDTKWFLEAEKILNIELWQQLIILNHKMCASDRLISAIMEKIKAPIVIADYIYRCESFQDLNNDAAILHNYKLYNS